LPSSTHGRSSNTEETGRMIAPAPPPGSASKSGGWQEAQFRPCIQIGGGPAQSAARRFKVQRNPRASSSLGFWFLICYAATQLAHPLQQTCIQVVRSNKVARKRLTESNGTLAMDPGHKDTDLMYTFAYCFKEDIRIRRHTNKRGIDLNKTQMRHGRKLDSRSVSLLWTRFIGTGAVFAGKRFCTILALGSE